MAEASLNGSYKVAAAIEVDDWEYANETQRIANHLPRHSAIRKFKHSVGQTLLNGAAGVALRQATENLEVGFRQNFPIISGLDEIDILATVEVPEIISLDEPTIRVNHLSNSSFEIWSVPSLLPDYWQKHGPVAVSTGLEGRSGIILSPTSNQYASVFQVFKFRVPANKPWTASVWYKIATNTLTAPATDFGLKITQVNYDGTNNTSHGIFRATTSGQWLRRSVTVTSNKEVISTTFEIIAKEAGTFTISDYDIELDCAQFEPGSVATYWRPDILDKLPYITREANTGLVITGTESAYYVDNLTDFWYKSAPTRSALHTTIAGTYEAVTTAGRMEITDFSKDEWLFLWEINGTKMRKRGSTVSGDIVQDYDIYARRYDGKYFKLDITSIESITVFGGYLWAVVKELDQSNVLIRTLHAVKIETPHPEPTYLLSVAGIRLDDIPIGETIIRLEFKFDDRQFAYISTSTTQYVVRLYYDLFTIDSSNRILYLREKYDSIGLV